MKAAEEATLTIAPPRFQQMRDRRLRQQERRGKIDRQRPLELVLRHRMRMHHVDQPGDIAQGIEPAEPGHGLLHQRRATGRIGEVGDLRLCNATGLANLRRSLFQPGGITVGQ